MRGTTILSAALAMAYAAEYAFSVKMAWTGFFPREAYIRSTRSKQPATSPPGESMSRQMAFTSGSHSAVKKVCRMPS
ncbi:hypothetical protein D3C87_1955740 [compost metagenome]